MGLFQQVSEKVAAGADWIEKTGEAAIDRTTEAGEMAYQAASSTAGYAYGKATEAIVWTRDKAVEAAEWTKEKAFAAGEWTIDKAVEVGQWVAQKTKQLDNVVAGALAQAIAKAATKYKPIEQCLEAGLDFIDQAISDPAKIAAAKKVDGQFMGNDCPNSSPNPPHKGRMPKGCPDGADLPKIIYTNGIDTSPEAACATMRKMADQQCAQIIGVYNASFGKLRDVLDSKNNIDGAGRDRAAHSQAQLIEDMLNKNPLEPVTIYAHSQGGLITQEGLQEAYTSMQRNESLKLTEQGMNLEQANQEAVRRTKAKMSNVTVHSFGTAETGWPSVGANYYQMTNTADPVPKLIHAVQQNRGKDTQSNNLKGRHRFEQNEWNPIGPHSMDDAYLPELNRVHPVPKNANGGCC